MKIWHAIMALSSYSLQAGAYLCNRGSAFECDCNATKRARSDPIDDDILCTDQIGDSVEAIRVQFQRCAIDPSTDRSLNILDVILHQRLSQWIKEECNFEIHCGNLGKVLGPENVVIMALNCTQEGDASSSYFDFTVALDSANADLRTNATLAAASLGAVVGSRQHLLEQELGSTLKSIEMTKLYSTRVASKEHHHQSNSLSPHMPLIIAAAFLGGYVIIVWIIATAKCIRDRHERSRRYRKATVILESPLQHMSQCTAINYNGTKADADADSLYDNV